MWPEFAELSPSSIIEDILPRLVRDNPSINKTIGAILAIELTGNGGGIWSIDLTGDPIVSAGLHGGAACLVKMEAAYFKELLQSRGTEPWVAAFSQNRISITGDLSIALRLGQVLASEMG